MLNLDQALSGGGVHFSDTISPEERLLTQIERQKADIANDPDKIDKLVSGVAARMSPVVARPKFNKFATKVEAHEATIPEDHPFKGKVEAIRNNFETALGDPRYAGVPAKELLHGVANATLGDSVEKAQMYKAARDSDVTNFFGLFGENKKFTEVNTEGRSQAEFNAALADKKVEGDYMSPGESAAWGAGLYGAGQVLAKAAPKVAKALTFGLARGAVGGPAGMAVGAASAALMAIPEFWAFDKVRDVVNNSMYGKTHEGTWGKLGVELALSTAAMGGVSKVASEVGGKAVFEAIDRGLLDVGSAQVLKNTFMGKGVFEFERKMAEATARAADAAWAAKTADAYGRNVLLEHAGAGEPPRITGRDWVPETDMEFHMIPQIPWMPERFAGGVPAEMVPEQGLLPWLPKNLRQAVLDGTSISELPETSYESMLYLVSSGIPQPKVMNMVLQDAAITTQRSAVRSAEELGPVLALAEQIRAAGKGYPEFTKALKDSELLGGKGNIDIPLAQQLLEDTGFKDMKEFFQYAGPEFPADTTKSLFISDVTDIGFGSQEAADLYARRALEGRGRKVRRRAEAQKLIAEDNAKAAPIVAAAAAKAKTSQVQFLVKLGVAGMVGLGTGILSYNPETGIETPSAEAGVGNEIVKAVAESAPKRMFSPLTKYTAEEANRIHKAAYEVTGRKPVPDLFIKPVTGTDIRGVLHGSIGNEAGVFDWATEKAILEKAGFRTDRVVGVHGTSGGHEMPTVEASNPDNLFGPGVYMTQGSLHPVAHEVVDVAGIQKELKFLISAVDVDATDKALARRALQSLESDSGYLKPQFIVDQLLAADPGNPLFKDALKPYLKPVYNEKISAGYSGIHSIETPTVPYAIQDAAAAADQANFENLVGKIAAEDLVNPATGGIIVRVGQPISDMTADFIYNNINNLDKKVIGYTTHPDIKDLNDLVTAYNAGKFEKRHFDLMKKFGADAGPNVRTLIMEPKNVFDVDAIVDHSIEEPLLKLANRLEEGGSLPAGSIDNAYTNGDLYNLISHNWSGGKQRTNAFLTSVGYDSITHTGGVGRAENHRVFIALKNEIIKPYYEAVAEDASNWTIKLAALAAIAVPLAGAMTLANPDSADAGLISEAMKGVTSSRPVAEAIAGKGMTFKEAYNAGLLGMPLPAGSKFVPKPMRGLFSTAPEMGMPSSKSFADREKAKLAKDTVVKRTSGLWLSAERFTSLNFQSKLFFNTMKTDAGYVVGAIAAELGSWQQAVYKNTDDFMAVMRNIVEGVPEAKRTVNEARKAMEDFAKEWQPKIEEPALLATILENKERILTGSVKNLSKLIEAAPSKKRTEAWFADVQKKLTEAQTELESIQKAKEKLNFDWEAAKKQYAEAVKPLAAKYPTTRWALALDDTATFEKYPWLKGMMTPEDEAAVQHGRNIYAQYAQRSEDAGLKPMKGPFNHYSRNGGRPDADLYAEKLRQLGVDFTPEEVHRGLNMTAFHHRGKYSLNYKPEWVTNFSEYVPDTERRIMGSAFWGKGKENSWWAFKNNPMFRGYEDLQSFFNRISDGMAAYPDTTAAKFAQLYTTAETFRLLGALPSAPFKHLFKQLGVLGQYGTSAFAQLPKAAGIAVRNAANQLIEMSPALQKMGLKVGRSSEDLIVDNFTRMHSFISVFDDLGIDVATRSRFMQNLTKWTQASTSGITAVEMLDRSNSFLAAKLMAEKVGLTEQQALVHIWDTIITNNFMGGVLNPPWMRNPIIRAGMLFQNTPFKIMERRVMMALDANRGLQTARGLIKGAKLEDIAKDLMGIRSLMSTADKEFKGHAIRDALLSEQNLVGQPVAKTFMREALLTGSVLWGGAQLGVNLQPHTFHIPGLQVNKEDPVLAMSPLPMAMYKTFEGAPPPTWGDENAEDVGFIGGFFRHWLGKGGPMPLAVQKMMKISEGDIPDTYKDSRYRYLFAIPGKKEE